VKDMVHDIHTRRQVRGEGIGYTQIPKAIQVATAIRVKIPLRVRHDDAKNAPRLERPSACAQEGRKVFARLQVLHEMLDANNDRRATPKGQRPAAIPADNSRGRRIEVQVDEPWQYLGPACHIYTQPPAPPNRS